MRQKTCCASELNTSVRVGFANRSGFDAPIGVVLAWEERGSCLNILWMTNRGRISETFTNYEAKDMLRIESNTSICVGYANRSGFDAPMRVVLAWEERGSCLNILWTTNHARISKTFTNYEAKDLLHKSVDHVLTYSGRRIAVESQKASRITRQKTCCASESNTSVRVVFANRSGFDAPIAVVLAWEERGSCLNILRTTNHGQILETFTNYEEKDLLRMSVDHVSTYSGRRIAVVSQKPSRITRQKTCCTSESNTSVHVVFANRSGFNAPIGVVLAREERGSCFNILRTTNRGWISETFTNYESSWRGRSVDRVLTYSGRRIAVGSQKPSRITRQKTYCASESNSSIRVGFANQSGFDAPIAVVLAWEERGSCLNILRTTNPGQISKTFMNYEEKDLLRKSVDHVLTYSERRIAVGSQKPSRITRQKTWCTIASQKPSRITRQKTCCASESNKSVRVGYVNQSGFDAPIGAVLAREELGSCLNILQTTNRGQISETFTIYESSWRGRSVDRVLTYSGRRIAVGSQKPSRITRQKTYCASESNSSIRVGFANQSGFDAPIAVVLAWEERGSCLNILRTTNPGQISKTFMNYEEKDLLRKSVDHVLTYCGRRIMLGSQKPSRITRQKTCCTSESNTSVRVGFENRSGFDAPIAVLLAGEERGSCLNILRTKNRGRISSSWHGRSVDHVLTYSGRRITANRSSFDAPIGVVLAWEERGSCLNILRTTNRSRISETFTNYEAKDLLRKSVDHVLTYSGRQIAVGSQKPLRITRQKTCCASESNTSVRVGYAIRSGFDASIGVVLAREERGSCLNILRTMNRGWISESFTNYEAKDLLRKNLNELRGKRLGAQVSQTRWFALDLRTGVVLMLQLQSSWHGSSVDHVLTYSGRRIAVGSHKPSRITRQKTFCAIASQKPSRITRQKTCCASESNKSVRVGYVNQSGFDAPIGAVLAREELGSCLNILQTTNRGQISETFTNYESSWRGRSVDRVLTYSGRRIAVASQKPSRITRQKTFCATVLAREELGSCLNILQTTNRGQISETFTNYESSWHGRSVDHVLTYSGRRIASSWPGRSVDHVLTYSRRRIAIESQKASRITRQKTCCASESNTSVRVVFANRSGFDAPIAVVLAWEERGSCLNILRTMNHGQILETFTNYEEKDLLRKSVDHVLTYSGRQIAVGSQKPSRITRQKTCCASESNTSVRVGYAIRSGFDASIGVVLAREERGSCLNILRTMNRGWISESFTNYEAKDLLRK
ncbi:DUF11 domain-containing protein [Senna tora]|uniref:DUF11 domain-containing protein n=1 Tax=Senna tora TaxID=362788 RepID=A0A834X784_9FABA|nr:DUF11 domain-containing protein [Senna tora]